MRTKIINRRRLLGQLVLLAGLPLLAACGRRGPLKRPKKKNPDEEKDRKNAAKKLS